ncbi:exported hypothetical protein [Mesorhizobium metallidurans STM 2683]|uniref:Uncharacterized protein n=1 Tax=Mesorhizobium metallidurans STM 2683 TaxID=1297569 RepID=M5F750_9HYPH|nr:exported hypothetical protein [Mesorhizobium metallidurans STM 2683]
MRKGGLRRGWLRLFALLLGPARLNARLNLVYEYTNIRPRHRCRLPFQAPDHSGDIDGREQIAHCRALWRALRRA